MFPRERAISCFQFARWIAAIALTSAPAWAEGRVYLDTGGGLAYIREAQPFFSGAPPTLNSGATFHLAVVGRLGTGSPFYAGLMHRLATGSDGAASYGLQATYPILRVENSGVFVTFGATPLVWRRTGSTFGIDAYKMASGSVGLLGELGYHYALTPEISFGASAGTQSVLQGGNFSPKLSMEFSGFMRLYFGMNSRDVEAVERDPGPYKGWRYPYGESPR